MKRRLRPALSVSWHVYTCLLCSERKCERAPSGAQAKMAICSQCAIQLLRQQDAYVRAMNALVQGVQGVHIEEMPV